MILKQTQDPLIREKSNTKLYYAIKDNDNYVHVISHKRFCLLLDILLKGSREGSGLCASESSQGSYPFYSLLYKHCFSIHHTNSMQNSIVHCSMLILETVGFVKANKK